MEKPDRREQARDDAARCADTRYVLVLNPSSSPCMTNRCDSLGNLLRNTQVFNHIYGASGSVPPAATVFVSDVIVLRVSIDDDGLKLVATCGNAWARPTVFSRIKRSGRFSFLSVSG
jgi:hypothetical protein